MTPDVKGLAREEAQGVHEQERIMIADIDSSIDWDAAPLCAAVEVDVEAVRTSILSGADVNEADEVRDWPVSTSSQRLSHKDGYTPLMRAAFRGKLEVVKALLDFGALVDVGNTLNVRLIFCFLFKVISNFKERLHASLMGYSPGPP